MFNVLTCFTRTLVHNNSDTLVYVNLDNLKIRWNDPSFDISVFQNCFGLKSLKLERGQLLEGVGKIRSESGHVANLSGLPECIQRLELYRF